MQGDSILDFVKYLNCKYICGVSNIISLGCWELCTQVVLLTLGVGSPYQDMDNDAPLDREEVLNECSF